MHPTPAAPVSRSWRWVHIAVAALLMVATLPGRSHGLGLFTEPILKTFTLDRVTYGTISLWATLLGAVLCLPCGWLLDRFGVRVVSVAVLLLLAAAVFGLGAWTGGAIGLFVLILLTRGFGQSALSVCSLALVGRSAPMKSGWEMAVYSCLVSVGFVAAFGVLIEVVKADPDEWRAPWMGIGMGVVVAAGVSSVLIRPSSLGTSRREEADVPSRTLRVALGSGAFWSFALGTSFYGLVTAGTSLFNESILDERGFSKEVFLNCTIVGIPVGLAANLLGGWLAMWLHLGRLFAAALVWLAVTLAAYPLLRQEWQAYLYASSLAAAGGVITVCFFTVWKLLYGPKSLGRIQGAAQLLTVLASAVGPLLFASTKAQFGSYQPMFLALAVASLALAALAWVAPVRPVIAVAHADGVNEPSGDR